MHLSVCRAEFNDSVLAEACNLPVPQGWPCKIRWQLVLWRVPSATSAGFSETSHCFNSMFNMTLSHTLFPSMNPPLSLIPLTPATYSCPSSSPKSVFLKCSALHLSEGFYSSNSKKGLPSDGIFPCCPRSHRFLLSLNSNNKAYVAPQNHHYLLFFFL